MSAWHRPDVETAALEHLTAVVGPKSARQIVKGLIAKGRATANQCSCFAADMHAADCSLSLLVVGGVEYSAAHWYRDRDGEFWAPIAHLDGSLELLCCGDVAYEPMALADALLEIGPITRTEFRSHLPIEEIRAASSQAPTEGSAS